MMCSVCNEKGKKVVCKGMCQRCYSLSYKGYTKDQILSYITHPLYKQGMSGLKAQEVMAAAGLKGTTPVPQAETVSSVVCVGFPRKQIVTLYECSDGREFGSEVEALRWELDIVRGQAKKYTATTA